MCDVRQAELFWESLIPNFTLSQDQDAGPIITGTARDTLNFYTPPNQLWYSWQTRWICHSLLVITNNR